MSAPQAPIRHYPGAGHVTEDTPPDLLEGYMDLEVTLPKGEMVVMRVHRSTPMMDLLVQVTTSHRIQPGGHVINVLSDNRLLSYKPSTPIGALDCRAIAIVSRNQKNEASRPRKTNLQQQVHERNIRLKPKEWVFRQQILVNLPRNQLAVYRLPPSTSIGDILEMVCKDKNLDLDSHEIRHPVNVDERLRSTCSLSDYQLNEIVVSSKDFRPPALSVTDLLTMASIAHPEDKKRSRGLMGFFSRRAKSSTGDSSLSSGSAGERSVSPARSDDSVDDHVDASVRLRAHQRNVPNNGPLTRPVSMISLVKGRKKMAPKPPMGGAEGQIQTSQTQASQPNLSRNSSDSSGYHEQRSSYISPSMSEVSGSGAKSSTLPSGSNLSHMKSLSMVSLSSKTKKKAPPPPPSVGAVGVVLVKEPSKVIQEESDEGEKISSADGKDSDNISLPTSVNAIDSVKDGVSAISETNSVNERTQDNEHNSVDAKPHDLDAEAAINKFDLGSGENSAKSEFQNRKVSDSSETSDTFTQPVPVVAVDSAEVENDLVNGKSSSKAVDEEYNADPHHIPVKDTVDIMTGEKDTINASGNVSGQIDSVQPLESESTPKPERRKKRKKLIKMPAVSSDDLVVDGSLDRNVSELEAYNEGEDSEHNDSGESIDSGLFNMDSLPKSTKNKLSVKEIFAQDSRSTPSPDQFGRDGFHGEKEEDAKLHKEGRNTDYVGEALEEAMLVAEAINLAVDDGSVNEANFLDIPENGETSTDALDHRQDSVSPEPNEHFVREESFRSEVSSDSDKQNVINELKSTLEPGRPTAHLNGCEINKADYNEVLSIPNNKGGLQDRRDSASSYGSANPVLDGTVACEGKTSRSTTESSYDSAPPPLPESEVPVEMKSEETLIIENIAPPVEFDNGNEGGSLSQKSSSYTTATAYDRDTVSSEGSYDPYDRNSSRQSDVSEMSSRSLDITGNKSDGVSRNSLTDFDSVSSGRASDSKNRFEFIKPRSPPVFSLATYENREEENSYRKKIVSTKQDSPEKESSIPDPSKERKKSPVALQYPLWSVFKMRKARSTADVSSPALDKGAEPSVKKSLEIFHQKDKRKPKERKNESNLTDLDLRLDNISIDGSTDGIRTDIHKSSRPKLVKGEEVDSESSAESEGVFEEKPDVPLCLEERRSVFEKPSPGSDKPKTPTRTTFGKNLHKINSVLGAERTNLRKAKSTADVRGPEPMAPSVFGGPVVGNDPNLTGEYMKLQDDFLKWQQQLMDNQNVLHSRVAPIATQGIHGVQGQSPSPMPSAQMGGQCQQSAAQKKPREITIPIRIEGSDEESEVPPRVVQNQPRPSQPSQTFTTKPGPPPTSATPNIRLMSWKNTRPPFEHGPAPSNQFVPMAPVNMEPQDFSNWQPASSQMRDKSPIQQNISPHGSQFAQRQPQTREPNMTETRTHVEPHAQPQMRPHVPAQPQVAHQPPSFRPPQPRMPTQRSEPHYNNQTRGRQSESLHQQEHPTQEHTYVSPPPFSPQQNGQSSLRGPENSVSVPKAQSSDVTMLAQPRPVPTKPAMPPSKKETEQQTFWDELNNKRNKLGIRDDDSTDGQNERRGPSSERDDGLNARFTSVVTVSNDNNGQERPQKDQVRSIVQLKSEDGGPSQGNGSNFRKDQSPEAAAPMSSRLVQAVQAPGQRYSPPRANIHPNAKQHTPSPPPQFSVSQWQGNKDGSRLSSRSSMSPSRQPHQMNRTSPPRSESGIPEAPPMIPGAPPPPPPAPPGPPINRTSTGKKIVPCKDNPQLDEREELMMAIRQFGGSGNLKKGKRNFIQQQ